MKQIISPTIIKVVMDEMMIEEFGATPASGEEESSKQQLAIYTMAIIIMLIYVAI